MYHRASSARYANYESASLVSHAANGLDDKATSSRHPPPLTLSNGHLPNGPGPARNGGAVKERLQNINSSMSWIREELEDLKESDRVLMDIFKQLEGDVAELTDNISNWRLSGSFGRPLSNYSELEEISESPQRLPKAYNFNLVLQSSTEQSSLESTLTSSKEEETSIQTGSGSDSLLAPELDSTSNSCSPVLPPVNVNPLTRSPVSGSGKRQASASPPLKGSASMNKIANSPSISRLQDETSSNISRNSSIDSGIQFASEAENGSANGVEVTVSPSTDPSPPTLGETSLSTDTKSNSDEDDSSLAAEVFSMLGFKMS